MDEDPGMLPTSSVSTIRIFILTKTASVNANTRDDEAATSPFDRNKIENIFFISVAINISIITSEMDLFVKKFIKVTFQVHTAHYEGIVTNL